MSSLAQMQVRKEIHRALEDRTRTLSPLTGDEDHLRRAYGTSYRWRARSIAIKERFDRVALAILSCAALLFVVAPVSVVVSTSSWDWPTVFLAYLGGLIVSYKAYDFIGWLLKKVSETLDTIFELCLIAAAAGTAYVVLRTFGSVDSAVEHIAEDLALIAALGASIYPIALLLVGLPLGLTWVLHNSNAGVRADPRGALLDHMFSMVNVASSEQRFVSVKGKTELLALSERIAAIFETALWREVELSRSTSRNTWRSRCQRCAQRVRSFDLWIISPRNGTREDLLGELSKLITTVSLGHFDDLPDLDTHQPGTRQRLRTFAAGLRIIALGAVPLACIYGAKMLGLDASGVLGGGVVIAAVIWLVLALISVLDNTIAARLLLLKDVAEAIGHFRAKP